LKSVEQNAQSLEKILLCSGVGVVDLSLRLSLEVVAVDGKEDESSRGLSTLKRNEWEYPASRRSAPRRGAGPPILSSHYFGLPLPQAPLPLIACCMLDLRSHR
jgi:hypothetical protein